MSRIITVRRLGTFGRFGNSLFLYAFAKRYAEMHDAILQTPEWIGQKIFNLSDPPITENFHQTNCDEVPWGKVNIDLLGYYQHADYLKIMSRSWLKSLFSFKNEWLEKFPKKDSYVAAHVRRGDYGGLTSIFCLINEDSYTKACEKFGLDINKLVWVHEDRPTIDPELESQGLGFMPDFMKLINADVILRANSTFSWWAGVLSNARILSPFIGDNRGYATVDFVEGNWPQMANFKKWQPHCPQNHGDLHLPE